MVGRLVEYPYVVVRFGCRYCQRAGTYRLARLAAKRGADIGLDELLERFAFDCPWRPPPGGRRPGKYQARCGAHFPDLDTNPPPSLPPAAPAHTALQVIEGGAVQGKSGAVGARKPRRM